MTVRDKQFVESIDLTFSELARQLNVSRQTVRQGVNNKHNDYLNQERLILIREHLFASGDTQRVALIDQRLQHQASEKGSVYLSLHSLLSTQWSEILCISPKLSDLQTLLTTLTALGPAFQGILQLYCSEDPKPLEPLCQQLPGACKIQLGHWPVSRCFPALIYLDANSTQQRAALLSRDADNTLLAASIELTETIQIPGTEAHCPGLVVYDWIENNASIAGRELKPAKAKTQQRREFDFNLGQQGYYRLILENAKDWGWLLRLEQHQEAKQNTLLQLVDATGREWLSVNTEQLPFQLIWPKEWPELEALADQGIFINLPELKE